MINLDIYCVTNKKLDFLEKTPFKLAAVGNENKCASRFDMGGVDTDDCAAGVNYLLENNLADKNKIGIF